ncbi:MAG: STAS domain-containing protein [Romboutsia timonensis]|uniref:STAS domain-containing protein n=1 Tax=Romboutsia timonensis TaxID=1776391 RepID=UPI003995E602
MSMNIDSKLNNENGFWDVSLQGELDVSTADKLKAHLHNLADEKILDMKINLENLDYIDSTGLGAMIGVLKKLKTDNKEIYIINPKSNVKKIFTITGLDKIFKVEG